ncbi:MAG: hypothetical protein ACI9MC_003214 [Kiritimatiellia bacterium]
MCRCWGRLDFGGHSDLTFNGNTGSLAGGINVSYGATVDISDAAFAGNVGVSGGGMHNGETVSMDGVLIVASSAVNGGGVVNTDGGVLDMSATEFVFNTAELSGGAWYNVGGLRHVTVDGTVTYVGGGTTSELYPIRYNPGGTCTP